MHVVGLHSITVTQLLQRPYSYVVAGDDVSEFRDAYFDAHVSVLRYFRTKRLLFLNHLKLAIAGIHLAFREKMKPSCRRFSQLCFGIEKARLLN